MLASSLLDDFTKHAHSLGKFDLSPLRPGARMNKINFVWSSSYRRHTLAGIVLLMGLCGSNGGNGNGGNGGSGVAEAANSVAAPANNDLLKGSVSRSAIGDVLAKLGIQYHEAAAGSSPVFVVDNVSVGSAAFGRGITTGDCILSVKQSAATYTLSVGRAGNIFHANLTALSAVAAHAPGKKLNGSATESGALLTAQAPALAAALPTLPVRQQHWPTVPIRQQRWPELNVKQNNIPMLDVNQKPFPERQIAQESDSVDQSGHLGDCWFEGTLAAFASVPRGQSLIANMVKQTAPGSYTVTFRGDMKATPVTLEEAQSSGLADRSRWALLIEDAMTRNYDANGVGRNLSRGGGPAIQVAMELMTGVPATVARADQYSEEQLGSLLDSLVRQQVPVSLSTKSSRENGGMPPILTMNHCYSLVDYSAASREVTLRNAYGREPNNPGAMSAGVKSIGDGRVQVPISLLPTYIRYIAYPSSNNY